MGGLRFDRQFLQGGVSRTVDALRIGIVFMHNRSNASNSSFSDSLISLIASKSSPVLPRVILSHKRPLRKNRSLFQSPGQKLNLDASAKTNRHMCETHFRFVAM